MSIITTHTKLLAHRGYSEKAPENTRAAFDLAWENKFDGLELDVHQTKDGKLVIIHDETVDRTSDGSGFVKDLTLQQLKKLNFSFKFNKNFKKEQILTYEEFLKTYGFKFKILDIEIKTNIFQYAKIEEKILKTTQKINPSAKIIYSSFNFNSLRILRKLDKNIKIGFLFVDIDEIEPIFEDLKKVCNYIHPWFKTLLNAKSFHVYQKSQLKINPWTFDQRNNIDEWTENSGKYYKKIQQIPQVFCLISNSVF